MRINIVRLLALLIILSVIGCGHGSPKNEPNPLIESLNIVNNGAARAHPWEEVKEFLIRDTVDREEYSIAKGTQYFAEKVHNRAEYYGFKTAIVSVKFGNGEQQILNAFETVDYGIVFVDCTGRGYLEQTNTPDDIILDYRKLDYGTANAYTQRFLDVPDYYELDEAIFSFPLYIYSSWDKIAYVKEGERLAFVRLDFEKPDFSYDWYKNVFKPESQVGEVRKERWETLRNQAEKYQTEFRFWFEKEASKLTRDDFLDPTGELQDLLEERTRLIDSIHSIQLEETNPFRSKTNRWKESDSPVVSVSFHW